MKLGMIERSCQKKSEKKRLLREGYIPAVLYSKGKSGKPVAVSRTDYETLVRNLIPGRLSSTKITLCDQKGKETHSIVKEVQYHPTTYTVLHLDFEELHEKTPVNVRVPIECIGTSDCVGVKLGGVVRSVIRKLKVRCLPKDIPVAFEVDVREMTLGQTRRLSDLVISPYLKPIANMDEVAVAIVKR